MVSYCRVLMRQKGLLLTRNYRLTNSIRHVCHSTSSTQTSKYDVVILGGGPVGCELARLASDLGRSVALVESTRAGRPLAAPTGWISKALRHGSMELGSPDGSVRVEWNRIEEEFVQPTEERALAMTTEQMKLNSVHDGAISFLEGRGTFVEPQRIALNGNGNINGEMLAGETVFLATGSVGTRIPGLPWEHPNSVNWLFNSHTIQHIGRLPHHIVIQGGGLIAVEYAFILRRLGARVTLVVREGLLMVGKGVDDDIKAAVEKRLRIIGVDIHFNDGDILEAVPPSAGNDGTVLLRSGATLSCDALASMVGRSGTAHSLDLPMGGLPPPSPSGHIAVVPTTMRVRPFSASFVHAPRVWAAGDVAMNSAISPIGLLSTGIAQAHLAIQSAFPNEWSEFTSIRNSSRNNSTPSLGGRILGSVGFDAFPPSAIWIEDGVGMVGLSETHANEAVPQGDWATTTVYFNETIKACVQPRPSDEMLKLVFQISTGRILGVHIFGADAAEMIHHAGGLVNNPLENTIWHVVKSVPPAVTYAEVLMKACYRAVDLIHDTNHPS